jgi:hypothetical protein
MVRASLIAVPVHLISSTVRRSYSRTAKASQSIECTVTVIRNSGQLTRSMQEPIDQPPMNLAHNIEELLTI